jgi:hypothetical protein
MNRCLSGDDVTPRRNPGAATSVRHAIAKRKAADVIPTNRRFGLAIRIRALGLALLLGLALGRPVGADTLVSSGGWSWWTGGITSGTPAPAQLVAAAASTPTPAPPASQPSTGVANAFINFGSGPYPDAGFIASGNPQAWYTSPQVAALFGGTPTAAQQAAFTGTVLQLTEQAFSQSGVSVNLTTNPTAAAAHTLSVVSNSSSIPYPTSIGTTTVGGSGFSFIDREAQVSSSVGQLEQILAHNLAHELMLAFGVPEKFDQTGNYLDATNANWAMMISPTSTFSPAAAQAINQALQAANSSAASSSLAQYVSPQAAPEPATILGWGLGLLALVAGRRLRGRRHPAG